MKKLPRVIQAALVTGVVVLLASGSAVAGYIKISGEMPDFGAVQEFEVSPDGRYAVYRADQEIDNAVNIYSVELSGGSPVRLGSPMPAGSGIASFQISPDSQRIVYLAPSTGPTVLDLYSSPIGGPASASERLTDQLMFGQKISAYEVSPDSAWVVYISDHEHTERFELYSVPMDGPASATRKLNANIEFDGGRVLDFLISPDSSRVIYREVAEMGGLVELYSVPLSDGGAPPAKLNFDNPINGVETGYRVSPDSSWVVYLAAEMDEWAIELFSVPIEGPASGSIKLNRPIEYVGSEWVFSAEISPDSEWVVYRFMARSQGGFRVFDLYSVPIAGPVNENIRLHEQFLDKGGVLDGYIISPDSSRVVFLALDTNILPPPSLFSAPIRENQAVKLNTISFPAGGVRSMRISPDSQRVVYLFHNWYQGSPEHPAPMLYSIPIDGPSSENVILTTPFPMHGEIHGYEISPDSSRVVYLADQQVVGVFELFMVPTSGPATAAVKLNGQLAANGNVTKFSILPDSSRVVYKADQEVAGRVELFMADDGLTEVKFTNPEMTVPKSSGVVTLPVELNQVTASTVHVNYFVHRGSASSGENPLTSGTLTFLSGVMRQEIELTLPDDNYLKGDDTLVVSLDEPVNAVLAEPSTMTITIILDDLWTIYLPLVGR
jgi:Tol biopolymer transport system component